MPRGPATPVAATFPFAPVTGFLPGLDPTLVMRPLPVPTMATRDGNRPGQDPTGLPARLQAEADAHAGHLPELRIAIDPAADYQALVRVLATADDAGMQRIRFEQR